MLLVGDIGGTNTRLAVFSRETGPRIPLKEAIFPSTQYSNLEAVVREFLNQINTPVEQAVFGVAGPVVSGRATITNLPWVIQETHVAEAFGLSYVHLLNDLESIANAVPYLEAEDLLALNQGERAPHGAIAVIAPGTGLGEGFLTWDGETYQAHPSEGGHTNFGPTNELEFDLLRYLHQKYSHVSYERLCSGIGIPNIYYFLKDTGRAYEPAWLTEQLVKVDDPTPVIVKAALDAEKTCEICKVTLDTFVSILGSEAANLALKVLATGGVYLAGGIPLHILPALKSETFMQAFRNKGRFAELLSRVPIHVVLHPKVGLVGAASFGFYHRH